MGTGDETRHAETELWKSDIHSELFFSQTILIKEVDLKQNVHPDGKTCIYKNHHLWGGGGSIWLDFWGVSLAKFGVFQD